MSIDAYNAYVLHTRAYRDSSLLVELFDRDEGRVSVIAKGARGAKSKWRSALQPFVPIIAAWQGRSSLKTLTQAETTVAAHGLKGQNLLSGFYLNELLVRLTHPHDPHPELFEYYSTALSQLASTEFPDAVLRPFELFLLQDLGYGFSLLDDANSGDAVEANGQYLFDPSVGLTLLQNQATAAQKKFLFSGAQLLAIHAGQWQDQQTRREAKRLMRLALAPYLGDKPLESRKLFMKPSVQLHTEATDESDQS